MTPRSRVQTALSCQTLQSYRGKSRKVWLLRLSLDNFSAWQQLEVLKSAITARKQKTKQCEMEPVLSCASHLHLGLCSGKKKKEKNHTQWKHNEQLFFQVVTRSYGSYANKENREKTDTIDQQCQCNEMYKGRSIVSTASTVDL